MTLKVFISYAKEDQKAAIIYYDLLLKEGVAPWLDIKKLLPGQNWAAEIEKAFSDSNLVILLLSQKSVNKRGFVQREANDAVERLRYKLPTDIYVIPLLLEPCEVPIQIANRLQYIELSTPGAWDQVRASLNIAAEQQSVILEKGSLFDKFQIFTEKYEDNWVGMPGHDIKIDYPRFQSSQRPDAAHELSLLFGGRASQALLEERQKPWEQVPDVFTEKDSTLSQNGRWDDFDIVYCNSRFLSLTYNIGWYGAGAAHPNSRFETYNFALLERVYPVTLEEFFSDADSALKVISKISIEQLGREFWERTGEKPDEFQTKWFNEGAGEKLEHFKSFTVNSSGFTFLFPPYQVSNYALGRWITTVSFYDLLNYLSEGGPYKLAAGE
ncbi:TIR domain-containing protein [Duganella phyllosphaerae]|uniref:TIR domain-containing protein n=1 Tax=Duganella phyllosphaerae TaxID=762836 RepID=A0A1E7W4V5_9BURK|nr:TIR domain-containing protein [Duganella phyllosphaerae]OEZ90738.1 hypothetical protein DUPY_53450 [Duganella phyllosphaerae]